MGVCGRERYILMSPEPEPELKSSSSKGKSPDCWSSRYRSSAEEGGDRAETKVWREEGRGSLNSYNKLHCVCLWMCASLRVREPFGSADVPTIARPWFNYTVLVVRMTKTK